MRRCGEPKESFTTEDNANGMNWPMQIMKGGDLYGFCPAKATWNGELIELFNLMVIAAETGVMLNSGGLLDQPTVWIDNFGWFVQKYNDFKFFSRIKAIFGDGGKPGKVG